MVAYVEGFPYYELLTYYLLLEYVPPALLGEDAVGDEARDHARARLESW